MVRKIFDLLAGYAHFNFIDFSVIYLNSSSPALTQKLNFEMRQKTAVTDGERLSHENLFLLNLH